MTFICDTAIASPSIDSILVVCKFLNIFPTNLPRVLPDWDINFANDLEVGTKPFSITPYWMVLTELKELKEKLHDLFNQGFIYPSVTPWGAVILFVIKERWIHEDVY